MDIEPTTLTIQLLLSDLSDEGDESSSAILEIIWSESTLHFFKLIFW